MNWFITVNVAQALITLAIALCWWQEHQDHKNVKAQRDRLNTENAKLVKQGDEIAKKYLEDTRQYAARIADLEEALKERDDEIKALRMQTVEIEQAQPVPVKRTRKKEKTA